MNSFSPRKPARNGAISPSPVDFRRRLLAWYGRHGRHDLPWRRTQSAYHILLSEFMLQQTGVSTVIPYYLRFLEKFPTIEKLAAAPLEKVLELWSGLGYYARARNLHAAAKIIAGDLSGKVPATRAEIEELPGIGRYTAGAVLSFAYNKPEAVVDGNVLRVLARVYGIEDSVKDPKTVEAVWALAWKLTPPGGARDFNNAIMDLGSLVCRPDNPDCLLCPYFKGCRARQKGMQDKIPAMGIERPRKKVHIHAALIESNGLWALTRRKNAGLYGGLWEFPGEETGGTEWEEGARELFGRRMGFPFRLQKRLAPVSHILTHREMVVHPWLGAADAAFQAQNAGGEPEEGRPAWFGLRKIESMAISSLTRRLLSSLTTAAS